MSGPPIEREITDSDRISLGPRLGANLEIGGLDSDQQATIEIAVKRRGDVLRRLRIRQFGNGRAELGTPQHLVGISRGEHASAAGRFDRLLELAGNALFAGILALGLATITGAVTLQVVTSGSMQPTLNVGDMVIAVSDDLKAPAIGEIVIFAGTKLDGTAIGPFAHRIVGGSSSDGWVTRGDNNPSNDPFVSGGTEIRGTVVATIPGLGRAFEPRVLLVLFGGLALFLLFR